MDAAYAGSCIYIYLVYSRRYRSLDRVQLRGKWTQLLGVRMNNSKWDDRTIAAASSSVIILGALLYYWVGEVQSTVELLELAYGSFKFFNNPMVF